MKHLPEVRVPRALVDGPLRLAHVRQDGRRAGGGGPPRRPGRPRDEGIAHAHVPALDAWPRERLSAVASKFRYGVDRPVSTATLES